MERAIVELGLTAVLRHFPLLNLKKLLGVWRIIDELLLETVSSIIFVCFRKFFFNFW
jgi:hypothetical protein